MVRHYLTVLERIAETHGLTVEPPEFERVIDDRGRSITTGLWSIVRPGAENEVIAVYFDALHEVLVEEQYRPEIPRLTRIFLEYDGTRPTPAITRILTYDELELERQLSALERLRSGEEATNEQVRGMTSRYVM